MGRGTSSHNLLIAALKKASLSLFDIKPAYLMPSDAGSAFANDSVDAWVIWNNRPTVHRAVDDYDHEPRVVRRVTIQGVGPVSADGRRSQARETWAGKAA